MYVWVCMLASKVCICCDQKRSASLVGDGSGTGNIKFVDNVNSAGTTGDTLFLELTQGRLLPHEVLFVALSAAYHHGGIEGAGQGDFTLLFVHFCISFDATLYATTTTAVASKHGW